MTPLDAVLDGLAVYRLTRLATADVLTQPLREHVIEAAYDRDLHRPHDQGLLEEVPTEVPDRWQLTAEMDVDPPPLATLVTCRWCASVWIAAAVLPWRRTRAWKALRWLLAASAAAALLARAEDGR